MNNNGNGTHKPDADLGLGHPGRVLDRTRIAVPSPRVLPIRGFQRIDSHINHIQLHGGRRWQHKEGHSVHLRGHERADHRGLQLYHPAPVRWDMEEGRGLWPCHRFPLRGTRDHPALDSTDCKRPRHQIRNDKAGSLHHHGHSHWPSYGADLQGHHRPCVEVGVFDGGRGVN